MELMLAVFAGLGGLELWLWWPPLWQRRKFPATVLVFPQLLVSLAIFLKEPGLWAFVLVFLSAYRTINLLRIIKARMQADYLYRISRRAAWQLIGLQALDAALAGLAGHFRIGIVAWLYLVTAAQLAAGAILFTTTLKQLRNTKPPQPGTAHADKDLPSLTVAIPARNETTDLEDCLQSLLTSTYPKLEILVLDDCSQNSRTPEIIRSFAHQGVRFVAGKTPPGQWLAKNYAYAQLAEEANGELLLFCGVDVRFRPDSLRRLVEILLYKKKGMLSLIPGNELPDRRDLASNLVQPARYAWELALPRRLLGRPPVLSTCWLISREVLQKAGGFAAVSRKAIPEAYLARQAAAIQNGYIFLQSDNNIGIGSHKSFDEQLATATRTRYPQLHRRLELVALTGLAEFSVLLWPLAILITGLLSRLWWLAALSGLGYCMEVITYSKVVNLTYRKKSIRGILLLPVAALYDIAILNYSMWRYEFREVIWKGRNVCIPVMRRIPEPQPAPRPRQAAGD
ncbi:MAG TPA: glycosyltransferase [Candidatus Saccharimonadales bacterium]